VSNAPRQLHSVCDHASANYRYSSFGKSIDVLSQCPNMDPVVATGSSDFIIETGTWTKTSENPSLRHLQSSAWRSWPDWSQSRVLLSEARGFSNY